MPSGVVYYLLGAAVSVFLAVHIVPRWRVWMRRRFLLRRADAELRREYEAVQRDTAVSVEDVERIWRGLASHYCIPPAKLRASDHLREELLPFFCDTKEDIWFTRHLFGYRGPAHEEAKRLGQMPRPTLRDMIHVLILYEKEMDTPLVERKSGPSDEAVSYQWIS